MLMQYATLEDTVYFWFGANDTSGSGADGASPVYDVRLAGAASDAAAVLSGNATLLTSADYSAGAHEVAIAATAVNGFAANNTYAVFSTLAVDGQNPTGFIGAFSLKGVKTEIGTGTGLSAIPWNASWDVEVQSEVQDAIEANNLDHLMKTAVANNTDMTTEVVDGTVLSNIMTKGSDTSDFVVADDSFEAIRDRGDAAWVTATGFATPTNITAGTITTVTNLTNAPTNGDLTATMKSSVTVAATAATPTAAAVTGAVGSVTGAVGSVTGNVGGNVVGSVGSVSGDTKQTADVATLITTVGVAGAGLTALALASVCTEARLSELDAGTGGKMANQVDVIETDTTAMDGRLTSARAGYLDKLNVSGTLLHSAFSIADDQVLTANSLPDVVRRLGWFGLCDLEIDEATGAFTFYKHDGSTPGLTGTIDSDSGTTTRDFT
jgi:hypothetical protein